VIAFGRVWRKATDEMKRSRFNEGQFIAILKEQEGGMPTARGFAAAMGLAR
jgi:hypothetical protein